MVFGRHKKRGREEVGNDTVLSRHVSRPASSLGYFVRIAGWYHELYVSYKASIFSLWNDSIHHHDSPSTSHFCLMLVYDRIP